jgi:hypothetical protein
VRGVLKLKLFKNTPHPVLRTDFSHKGRSEKHTQEVKALLSYNHRFSFIITNSCSSVSSGSSSTGVGVGCFAFIVVLLVFVNTGSGITADENKRDIQVAVVVVFCLISSTAPLAISPTLLYRLQLIWQSPIAVDFYRDRYQNCSCSECCNHSNTK